MTVLLFLPRPSKASGRVAQSVPSLRDTTRLLKARGPVTVLFGVVLYGAGYGLFVSVLPASLAQTKGFDSFAIGLFFALFYAAVSLSQLIIGPLSDRHGRPEGSPKSCKGAAHAGRRAAR